MNSSSWTAAFRSPAELQHLLSQWGPRLAVGVLALALAAEAAVLITRQVPTVPPDSSGDANAGGLRRPARRGSVAGDIVAAHLFGNAATATDGNAPRTSLQLVLAGVLASDDPARGQAILGPATNSAKLYSTGQTVAGGARLNAVYRDRVLLENRGIIEALYLPRTVSSSAPAAKSATPAGGQRLQAAFQNNPSLLNGAVRLQAVFNQGKLSGYRVFPGRGGQQIFNQMGLRAGDLITAVSGTQLDDAGRAAEVVQTLGSADSAVVTVSRNGQSEDVTLNLSEVATAAENIGNNGAGEDGTAENGAPLPGGPNTRFGGGRPGGPRGGGPGSSSGTTPVN